MAAFALGGFRFLFFFELLALFFVHSHRLVGNAGSVREVGAQFLHLRADLVDLDKLFRSEQTDADHSAINQSGAFISRRRDEVAAAKPWVAEEGAGAAGAATEFIAGQGSKLAGIEIEFAGRLFRGGRRGGWRRRRHSTTTSCYSRDHGGPGAEQQASEP